MAQYKIGTVGVTNGSNIVTSDGTTAFLTQIAAGQLFTIVGSGVPYVVSGVTDNSHFTLTTNYAGTTATTQAYVVARDFTPTLNLPYISKGDVETATIMKAQAALLDQIVALKTSLSAPSIQTGTTYTVGATDSSIIFNGTATATITLPTASANTGRWLHIKTIAAFAVNSATSNVKPIATNTAGTAIVTATAGKWASLQSDGTSWVVMATG